MQIVQLQPDVLDWPQMRFLSAELTTEGGSEGLSLFLFVERGVVLAVGRMTKAISLGHRSGNKKGPSPSSVFFTSRPLRPCSTAAALTLHRSLPHKTDDGRVRRRASKELIDDSTSFSFPYVSKTSRGLNC